MGVGQKVAVSRR